MKDVIFISRKKCCVVGEGLAVEVNKKESIVSFLSSLKIMILNSFIHVPFPLFLCVARYVDAGGLAAMWGMPVSVPGCGGVRISDPSPHRRVSTYRGADQQTGHSRDHRRGDRGDTGADMKVGLTKVLAEKAVKGE